MREIAALAVGYVLGSVLPAYLLGWARGIDLRTTGTGNAGTTNAYRVLGPWAGAATAAYDGVKGIASVFVAWRLGVSEPVAFASGILAILGHRYPFYLRFRGARGFAVTLGLACLCTGVALYRGWLGPFGLVALLALYVALLALLHRGAAAQLLVIPLTFATVAWRSTDLAFDVFFGMLVAFIWYLHFTALRAEGALPSSSRAARG